MGRKIEQSKKAYDQKAFNYDSTPEGKYTREHQAELLNRVAIKDGDTILDVACGNGFLLAELSKKANVSAFGVDISENMITVAKRRYSNCTFITQPCIPLPFEDASVDVITVSCAFHHFENPQGFANECKRVLKGNRAVYMAEPYYTPLIRRITNAVVLPLLRQGDVKVYSAKELGDFFEAAGFSRIQTYSKGTVLFFSARK